MRTIDSSHIFDEVGLLKRYLNDEALARELVQLFVAKAPGYISVIRECREAGNHLGVQHQAHSLKGAAETLGANRIALLASEIVALGKINELDKVTKAVQQLVVEYETLVTLLAERGWTTQK